MIGFGRTDSPVTLEQINGVELVLGVRFPGQYRELIQDFNHSYGSVFFQLPVSDFTAKMDVWLSLAPWDTDSIWSALSTWEELDINRKVIPFGEDGGGNWICFDFREKDVPNIVFYFHEIGGDEGLYPAADDFNSFIDSFTMPPKAA